MNQNEGLDSPDCCLHKMSVITEEVLLIPCTGGQEG